MSVLDIQKQLKDLEDKEFEDISSGDDSGILRCMIMKYNIF